MTAGVIALAVALAQPAAPAPAEPPPATEVFLASLTEADGRGVVVGVPSNISNSPGYDNQPHFTPAGDALLFTSMRDGTQTDIYRYDFRARMLVQLTSTKESEYSPTVVPDRDGFSVVRVEADGTQRLWKFPFRPEAPSVILPDVEPVGYHAWADSDTLVLFVLGDSPTLEIASVKSGRAEKVAERPGRTFAPRAPGTINVVLKTREKGPWRIAELDTRTRRLTDLVDTLAGSEDYAILPDGRVLMGSGSKIFLWDRQNPWREVADLAGHGLADITRLAVSPSGSLLAIVCRQPQPPA